MQLSTRKSISVIIVYTDETKLNEAVKYVNSQTCSDMIQIVLLDNRGKTYRSAAEALNCGAEKAEGEVVVFMHQDVYLWDNALLEKYYGYLHAHGDTVLGVCGVAQEDRSIYYDFCETDKKIYRGKPTGGALIPAVTLDECMFAMKKSLWQKLKFDEAVCDNWHFYAADICYANLLGGGKNVILSADICHESTGNFYNKSYRRALKRMVKKYKGKLKRIETTCVNVRCNMLGFYIYAAVSRYRELMGRQ